MGMKKKPAITNKELLTDWDFLHRLYREEEKPDARYHYHVVVEVDAIIAIFRMIHSPVYSHCIGHQKLAYSDPVYNHFIKHEKDVVRNQWIPGYRTV